MGALLFFHFRVMNNISSTVSSITYLLTKLPYAGLYNYNGGGIEFFHMKWFNCVDRLTGPTTIHKIFETNSSFHVK